MRKIVVTIMIVILVGIISCGGKSETTTHESSSSGSAGEANKAKPQKITVWCWDPNFNGYSMKKAAELYQQTHPEVTVEIVDVPDNIEGKIEAGLQAGGAGLPDIALFQDYIIEKFIKNYPGVFVDLQARGVDYSQFAQYKVAPMSKGNEVYGIPFDTGSTGLFLRADLIEEAGLNPLDYQKEMTWSEVITLGEKVKNKIGKPLLAYIDTSSDFFRIMVQSTGTQFFKDDGSVDYNTLGVRKSLEYLQELNNKGLLFRAEGRTNQIAAFNGGEAVGFMEALWIIGTLKTNPDYAGKWMVIPTPRVEGVDGARNASNNGGSSWYVFSSGKNADTAVDFLQTTWASSTPEALEFYNTILKDVGAMGTFLPSRGGSNYVAEDDYFYMSQPVYKDFSTWMENVPVLYYTPNYEAMRTALNNAIQLMLSGELKTVDEVIARAESEYKQTTGN